MTTSHPFPASFAADSSVTAIGSTGAAANKSLADHTARLELKRWDVAPGVWCIVGNGLSNQTFIEGPDGLIAIDTGECVEEMAAALALLREVTDQPIAAVIYTHFHYVGGTTAIEAERSLDDLPIWSHERVPFNLSRAAGETGPTLSRGLVHQFGMFLPPEGPDSLINVGLGLAFRNPDHTPYTGGYAPPTETVGDFATATIAGLTVEFTHAPSDSDDSLTIWFPDLGVAVNNLAWPAVFNVFPIRGESYRDPQGLLAGLDHLISLGSEYLLGAHGPPFAGADTIRDELTLYRDSIQFMWDQTVRGLNQGLLSTDIAERVQLPEEYGRTYMTQQHYGLVEHHARQIQIGIRGWFDNDEGRIFPLPTLDRCQRLIAGFGGRETVAEQAEAALDADDLRWALELASWLVHSETGPDGRADGGSEAERALLAEALRQVAQRTTSANVRSWCLTRALDLEGSLDLSRFRVHRLSAGEVRSAPADRFVGVLRVLVDPVRAAGVDQELALRFSDGTTTGLHVRNSVSVSTDGSNADTALELDLDTWAKVLGRKTTMAEALADGSVTLVGDRAKAAAVLGSFELTNLHLD